MTLQSACLPGAHEWTPGAACSPNTCAVPGICCDAATGACRRLTQSRCGSPNIWLTSKTCAPSPCSMPYGACCNVVVGTCAISMLADCAPAAHDWFAGGTCSPNTCAAPAACCNLSTGACRRLTQIRCLSAEGSWLSGQTCSPNPCPASLVAPCAADFNGSGGADLQDVMAFLSAWFALEPSADINASHEIDAADIFDFLTAWFSGC